MYKKNYSVRTGVIIIIIGILIFVAIGIYAYNKNAMIIKSFDPEQKARATKYYDLVKAVNLETSYPESPEKVVEMYNNIAFMFYGGMIIDDNVTKELLEIQRKLYSEELLSLNSLDNQLTAVIKNTKTLVSEGAKTIEFEAESADIDENNPNLATVYVKQSIRTLGDIEWVYYLIKENDRWKINITDRLETSIIDKQ